MYKIWKCSKQTVLPTTSTYSALYKWLLFVSVICSTISRYISKLCVHTLSVQLLNIDFTFLFTFEKAISTKLRFSGNDPSSIRMESWWRFAHERALDIKKTYLDHMSRWAGNFSKISLTHRSTTLSLRIPETYEMLLRNTFKRCANPNEYMKQ